MSKTAILVGASGGIGAACARELRGRGFELILNARREGPLAELAGELDAEFVAGDCNDGELAAEIVARAPRIDVVVHAAGILRGKRVREQSVDTFDEVVRANLRSAYVIVHAALPRMTAGGRIVLVSSTSATRPMRGLSAYSAAKAGLHAFAMALSGELERDGINVNLVSPGPVDTPMMSESVNEFAVLEPEDVSQVVGWLTDLPPHVVIHDVALRRAFKGPFATRVAGSGTEGLSLEAESDGE